jgi:hypothetical protein
MALPHQTIASPFGPSPLPGSTGVRHSDCRQQETPDRLRLGWLRVLPLDPFHKLRRFGLGEGCRHVDISGVSDFRRCHFSSGLPRNLGNGGSQVRTDARISRLVLHPSAVMPPNSMLLSTNQAGSPQRSPCSIEPSRSSDRPYRRFRNCIVADCNAAYSPAKRQTAAAH